MKIEHRIVLTKKERADAKKTLAEVRRLFGNKGQHWMQHEVFDGDGNYCLVGALDKANGPGMEVAKAVIALSLPDAYKVNITDLEDYPGDTADETIPSFNDSYKTTFKNIRGVLTRAGKLLK